MRPKKPWICVTDVTFQNDRISLRPANITDLPTVTKWWKDDPAAQLNFNRENPLLSRAQINKLPKAVLHRSSPTKEVSSQKVPPGYKRTTTVPFIIESLHNPRRTGIIVLDEITTHSASTRIYTAPEFRKKLHASDAEMLVLKFAFEALGLKEVHASFILLAEASMRFHFELGFRITDRKKRFVKRGAFYYDLIKMTMKADDFERWRNEYVRRRRFKFHRWGIPAAEDPDL